MGKAAQAEALFPDAQDGVAAAAQEERDVQGAQVVEQGGASVAAIQDVDRLAAWRQASRDQQQQGILDGILAFADLVVRKAGKGDGEDAMGDADPGHDDLGACTSV
jgi:hypothetical protein